MNAKPRDVRAGWEIFRESAFTAILDEINSKLASRGFNPISDRTYASYKKLSRYGYERYVPINRLDVATLRDPVWGSPIISRYKIRRASVSVNLITIYQNKLAAIEGSTEELGETEARVLVTAKGSQELIASDPLAFEGLHCLVHLSDQDVGRSASIEVVELLPDAVRLTLDFMELVPTSQLTGRETLDPASMRMTVRSDDSEYFVNLIRVLHAVFEAVDSARVVCDEVLAQLDVESRFVLPPPTVGMLTKSSPLVIELGSAWPPLAVFGSFVLLYLKWWKEHNEGRLVRKQGDEVAARAESISEQTRGLRLQHDLAEFRNQLIKKLAVQSYVIDTVRGSLPESMRGGDIQVDRLQSLIDKQLLPSIEHILLDQLEDIQIESSRTLETPDTGDESPDGESSDP